MISKHHQLTQEERYSITALPSLDGIIFRSVQAENGRNVVLFHKAALVEAMEFPVVAIASRSALILAAKTNPSSEMKAD